jgi:uncharacterized protein (DUF983 family)
MLIVGFVILIVGMIILLHGIFNMMPANPTQESLLIWLTILVMGAVLTMSSIIAISFAQD